VRRNNDAVLSATQVRVNVSYASTVGPGRLILTLLTMMRRVDPPLHAVIPAHKSEME